MIKFLRVVNFFWLRCRIYYGWSKLFRVFNNRKYRKDNLPIVQSVKELENTIGAMKWRADTWRQWFDSIELPEAAFVRMAMGQPAGDCEDIACAAANMLRLSALAGFMPTIANIGLLTVLWKGGGHTVAVFSYTDIKVIAISGIGVLQERQWAHVGNWYDGKIKSRFESLNDIIKDVLSSRECVGWCYVTPSLEHLQYGTGSEL